MSPVVYDAGALIAAERGSRVFWADHRVRLEQRTVPVVPAAVVAQVSRSPRQVQLRRLLKGCDVAALDGAGAHAAGRVLTAAGTSDVVDATVVLLAAGGATIVTSDRADIEHLLAATGTTSTITDV